MITQLELYRKIVGDEIIEKIYSRAKNLSGRHIVHINSTSQGGGVAEMLNSIVILMNEIGIRTGWRVIHGTPDFFGITKKFHHGLHGEKINLSSMKKQLYFDTARRNAIFTHIDHDCVIVHDPQPLPLINFYKKNQPWVWRCHLDVTAPEPMVWNYLKSFITKYDCVILSMQEYKKTDLKIPQRIIMPSIDPLTVKNKELEEDVIEKYLAKYGIKRDKPIISQVSRFDKWKDPLGVVATFKLIKRKVPARLVLLGEMAADDPEGQRIREQLLAEIKGEEDIILVDGPPHVLVNAIQKVSTVVMQKSIREGFGLTVSEALWKGTPVVASNVGGIRLQIKDGENGFLINDPRDNRAFAERIIRILEDPRLREKMGRNARETVRKNFLVTRHLLDYLELLNELVK